MSGPTKVLISCLGPDDYPLERRSPSPIDHIGLEMNFDKVVLLYDSATEEKRAKRVAQSFRVETQIWISPGCPDIDLICLEAKADDFARTLKEIIEQHLPREIYINPEANAPSIEAAIYELIRSEKIQVSFIRAIPTNNNKFTIRVVPPNEYCLPIYCHDQNIAMGRLENAKRYFSLFGCSGPFNDLLRSAVLNAHFDRQHHLLVGEVGVEFEAVAKLMKAGGKYLGGLFIKVQCASIQTDLSSIEKPCKNIAASESGGILFLKNVDDLSLADQGRLLGIIERYKDVRIIATAPPEIQKMMENRQFRSDLFYLFTPLRIPPLRARRTDIPEISNHILKQWNRRNGKTVGLLPAALQLLENYPWKGNRAELRLVIEQAAIRSTDESIDVVDLRAIMPSSEDDPFMEPEIAPGFDMLAHLSKIRNALIDRALEKSSGRQVDAARLLGISAPALSQEIKRRQNPQGSMPSD